MTEITYTVKPCNRWRRVLGLTMYKGRTLSVRLLAVTSGRSKHTALAYNSLPLSSYEVMFEPYGGNEAALIVGSIDSTHFPISRKDGLAIVERFGIRGWNREPSVAEREEHEKSL